MPNFFSNGLVAPSMMPGIAVAVVATITAITVITVTPSKSKIKAEDGTWRVIVPGIGLNVGRWSIVGDRGLGHINGRGLHVGWRLSDHISRGG